jgi:4-azaleucine resistance transporter AzlC
MQALRDATPIVAGYFTVSFVFGLMAVSHGLPVWAPVAMSLMVYAGASQFSCLTLYTAGAPILTILVSTFLINLRHLLMSVCISASFDKYGIRTGSRLLYAVGLTDESFAIHSTMLDDRSLSPTYLIAFNGFCHGSWVLGSLIGGLAALYASGTVSLDFDYALTAMMLYVLVSLVNSMNKMKVATTSVIAMCALNIAVPSYFNIFVAAAIGCMVGIWTKRA